MSPVERLLERLKGCRRTSSGREALCPAHDDHDASLSIAEATDGKALVNCHAGCSIEDVVAAVGLKVADLFPSDGGSRREDPYVVGEATYRVCDTAGAVVA